MHISDQNYLSNLLVPIQTPEITIANHALLIA